MIFAPGIQSAYWHLAGQAWEKRCPHPLLLPPSNFLPGSPLAKRNWKPQVSGVRWCGPCESASQGRERVEVGGGGPGGADGSPVTPLVLQSDMHYTKNTGGEQPDLWREMQKHWNEILANWIQNSIRILLANNAVELGWLLFQFYICIWASLMAQGVKNHQQYRGHRRPGFHPWVWKIPGGGNDHPLQWPRECHGQKILVGYSPKGHKEVETTEWQSAYIFLGHCVFGSSCFKENSHTFPPYSVLPKGGEMTGFTDVLRRTLKLLGWFQNEFLCGR